VELEKPPGARYRCTGGWKGKKKNDEDGHTVETRWGLTKWPLSRGGGGGPEGFTNNSFSRLVLWGEAVKGESTVGGGTYKENGQRGVHFGESRRFLKTSS